VRAETEDEEEEGKNGDQSSQNEPKTTNKVEPTNHHQLAPPTIATVRRAASTSAPISVAVTALTMQIIQKLVPVDQSGSNGTETTNKVSKSSTSNNNIFAKKSSPANVPRKRGNSGSVSCPSKRSSQDSVAAAAADGPTPSRKSARLVLTTRK
jgi:hypothetical protein